MIPTPADDNPSSENLEILPHQSRSFWSALLILIGWAAPYFLWFSVFFLSLDVLLYVDSTANPLVSSDSWYFLDAFLGKALNAGVHFSDFFVKRGGGLDHAQPLNKLILLLNLRLFDLDFSVDAMIGAVFALAGFLLLYVLSATHWHETNERRPAYFYLGMTGIAAIYLSLNSSEVFNWSLVTLAYVGWFAILLSVFTAWRVLRDRSIWLFVVVHLLVGMVFDDVALIASVGEGLAIALMGWKLGKLRKTAQLLFAIVGIMVICRIFYAFFLIPADTGDNVSISDHLAGLVGGLSQMWKWVIIPAASSIAFFGQLQYYFGDHWSAAQIALGAAVAVAHVWFWINVWRTRPNVMIFAGVCLMLLMYGLLAGVLYGRISNFGGDYLNQPRYVVFYLLGPVALLLGGIGASTESTGWARLNRATTSVLALCLLFGQIPLSRRTWIEAPYISRYYQSMASQMGALGKDPAHIPKDCVPLLPVCQWPVEKRAELMQLLIVHQLNLYSPRFQQMHRLYPEPKTIAQ